MRLALVSGDGLPVSGLLPVFRNAVNLGIDLRLLDLLILADLGYSWRTDQPELLPNPTLCRADAAVGRTQPVA